MCDFLSGWINLQTKQIECADLQSHARTQELLGWSSADLSCRREWEWTKDDCGKSLVVRTSPDDPKELAAELRAEILTRHPTRSDALRECLRVIGASNQPCKTLYLRGVTIPPGLVIPPCKTLYLHDVTIPPGLVIPPCETLYLYGARSTNGIPVHCVDGKIVEVTK